MYWPGCADDQRRYRHGPMEGQRRAMQEQLGSQHERLSGGARAIHEHGGGDERSRGPQRGFSLRKDREDTPGGRNGGPVRSVH